MSNLNELFEDPSAKLDHFQATYDRLKTAPDAEPPRRLMFEFEKPQPKTWLWRWLAPMTASAAVAFAVVTFTPRPQSQPQIIERVVQQQAPAPAPSQVNYQQMIDELRAELRAKEVAQAKEVQRVRGEVDEVRFEQRIAKKEDITNTSEIQQQVAALLKRN